MVVRVKEPLFRWAAWRITQESAGHIDMDARTIAWDLKVVAGEEGKPGETVLTYTVEYTW